MSRQRRERSPRPWSLLLLVLLADAVPSALAATDGPKVCIDGPTRLCLSGRFAVEASWRDDAGRERAAFAVPLGAGGTGAFAFAGGENADLLVRVGAPRGRSGELDVQATGVTGAAYELRILDTVTGLSWTRTTGEMRTDRLPPASVESLLEGALPAVLEASYPETAMATPCRDTARDRCLLGGRFLARMSFRNEHDQTTRAWAMAGGGASGLFSASEHGDAEATVRVVDGRAVNGHFWLLYGTISTAEAEIEIVDLATGNSRRFAKPDGATAGVVVDALSVSAAVVQVTLDAARAATTTLGPAGGALEATDAHGTRFRLVVPKNALIAAIDVTLTPVATMGGLPFAGGLSGAVVVQPQGVILGESALLTIATSLPRAQQSTFGFRGLAGELALAPPLVNGPALVLPVHRFGGYGVAAGTAAELTAQLGRLPTRPEDRFLQRLAGILLPLRRAGKTVTALPATVLQLLQQEYTTSIKPRVLALKLGNLEANYPVVRNWQNAAKDTGQSAKLATQLQEVQAAEIAGAVLSYNRSAVSTGAATGDATAAASKPCKTSAAAGKTFRAYFLLKSRGKQGLVSRDKLDRCVRFELKFNTLLDWRPPGPRIHEDVEVSLILPFNDIRGVFRAFKATKVNEERITQPECDYIFTLEKVGVPTVSSMLFDLEVPGFSWSDELVELVNSLHYEIEPTANQDWKVTCAQKLPTGGILGPFSALYHVSWSGNYTSFHLSEIDGHGFKTGLVKSASPGVFAEKVWNKGNEIAYFEEHTLISVFFKPQ